MALEKSWRWFGFGDSVQLSDLKQMGIEGVVTALHHIPNGDISVASNMTMGFARVNLNVPIAHNANIDSTLTVLNDVCADIYADADWLPRMNTKPQVIRIDVLGTDGLEIKVMCEVKAGDQWAIAGELRLRIKRAFDAAGIPVPIAYQFVHPANPME